LSEVTIQLVAGVLEVERSLISRRRAESLTRGEAIASGVGVV